MSTTFDVYPRTKRLPSFAAIIDRSTTELHRFLASVSIKVRPPIHLRIQRCEDHSHVPFSLTDPARWAKDTYAWFMVGEVPGGTDAYFDDDAARVQQLWDGGFDDPRCKRIEPLIRECISTGHRWWFRRSAGQPAIINVAYGLIAASLAAITEGFLTSDDSAWDWQRLPALPNEFLSWYFRPEEALAADFRSWSTRCLGFLAEELEPREVVVVRTDGQGMTPEREEKRLQRALRTISVDAIAPEIESTETGDGLWCLVNGNLSFVPASGARTDTLWDNMLAHAQFVRWVKAHPERIHTTHEAAVAFVRSVLTKE